MIRILHLSQTDIKSDSRILKEMQSIARSNPILKVYGIGVKMDKGMAATKEISGIEIESISLVTSKIKILPKSIIKGLSVLEIMGKMFFKGLKLKPQVIHCHDTPVLPLGVMLKLFTKSKLIYDAHELESERNGLTKTLSKLTLFVEKILWRYIDALIVVSPSIENWYKYNIGKKYSEIILNSPVVEKNDIPIDKSYFRNKFSIPTESKIFLYIGILGRGRGLDLITDAFNKEGIKSHVVFLGYGELTEKLKLLAKNKHNIHVHEAVAHEQVVTVAKSADVGLCLIQNVSLSDYYCLPNKLFEYCFAEIPVLASNFPDIRYVVEKYNLGKCTELDTQDIYKAIQAFEESEALPQINVSDLFELTWEAQEEKLIKLYDRFIDNGKGS